MGPVQKNLSTSVTNSATFTIPEASDEDEGNTLSVAEEFIEWTESEGDALVIFSLNGVQ